ncbi:MAG: hypothetical protein J5744_09245 [Oscillospiraceae bacterium]|nr:hypothetical protein [Oscillospiraceae bacterium]
MKVREFLDVLFLTSPDQVVIVKSPDQDAEIELDSEPLLKEEYGDCGEWEVANFMFHGDRMLIHTRVRIPLEADFPVLKREKEYES